MKTFSTFMFVFFAVSVLCAQPQIQEGVYSVSGGVMFSSSSTELPTSKHTTTGFSFSPNFSYFILDQIEISLAPSYDRLTSETTSSGIMTPSYTSTLTSTSLGAQIGLRYYFAMETAIPFIGIEGGLSWDKLSGTYLLSSSFSPPTKTYTLTAGLDYFFHQAFAIEPSIRYRGSKSDSNSDSGFNIGIGVKYFIF